MKDKPFCCENCGREMRPAPARWDGEPTFVGFHPCACDRPIMTDYGTIYPGSPEHQEMLESGRYCVGSLLAPVKIRVNEEVTSSISAEGN